MKYLHELSLAERSKVLTAGKTYGELWDEYKQPEWCNYPENAIHHKMGCWSLMSNKIVITEDYCSECMCYKNKIL